MIPGLGLIEKLFTFGLDLFVRNRAKRDELKRSFDRFFRASSKDSQVSSDLHSEHQRMRRESWEKSQSETSKN